jgi:thiol-disulfide isomerase/thioredoxin
MDKTARKARSHKQVGMTPIRNVWLLVIAGLLVCPVVKGDNRHIPAPEFDASLSWLNVERPLSLMDLRGKVVILDFWTSSCINCLHIIPDLRKLERKYGQHLAIIGVHSPKFDHEKNIEALRNSIVRYGLRHPVVSDVNFLTWKQYGARAWPTLVVIDPESGVVGRIVGEGHHELLDNTVGDLLKRFRTKLDARPLPMALEKRKFSRSLLAAPEKIAISERFVAISDTLHHRIIVANHRGKIQHIFGGMEAGFADGDGSDSRFSSPRGLAFSENGLFVADTNNHAIRFIDLVTRQVRTVAGNGRNEHHGYGVYEPLTIGLRSPWALAYRAPMLYVAMAGAHQIWRFDVDANRIGPFAGSGHEGITDGALRQASFSQPSGLTLSGDSLYVADPEASAVRRIDLINGRVQALVGTGLFDFGDHDGPFAAAKLQRALGIAALGTSKVLLVDTYNHKLKVLDTQQRAVTTLAGTGWPGKGVGNALESALNEPGGLAVYGKKILISDTNNHRILQFDRNVGRLTEWRLRP